MFGHENFSGLFSGSENRFSNRTVFPMFAGPYFQRWGGVGADHWYLPFCLQGSCSCKLQHPGKISRTKSDCLYRIEAQLVLEKIGDLTIAFYKPHHGIIWLDLYCIGQKARINQNSQKFCFNIQSSQRINFNLLRSHHFSSFTTELRNLISKFLFQGTKSQIRILHHLLQALYPVT